MQPGPTRAPAVELYRHGGWHGWVEPIPAESTPLAEWGLRWHTGRPIHWKSASAPLHKLRELWRGRAALLSEHDTAQALLHMLSEARPRLSPEYEAAGPLPARCSSALELLHCAYHWADASSRHTGRMRDLWVYAARLSAVEGENSFWLRVGFGRGGTEQDGPAQTRQRRSADLAQRLLPEFALLEQDTELLECLQAVSGGALHCSHHTAYWIDADGGLLFDDPSLPEDPLSLSSASCYLALQGKSVWLALSRAELLERLLCFAGELQRSPSNWLLEQLYPTPAARTELSVLLADQDRAQRELARSGGGAWRAILGRGPEFTLALSQAGHAYHLEAGDILILPHAHPSERCYSSCFGTADQPAYGLWVDLRQSELPYEAQLLWDMERRERSLRQKHLKQRADEQSGDGYPQGI